MLHDSYSYIQFQFNFISDTYNTMRGQQYRGIIIAVYKSTLIKTHTDICSSVSKNMTRALCPSVSAQ